MQPASPLRELTCMLSHSVTCYQTELTFPPLPQPIKAITQFSDPSPEGCKLELTKLVWLYHSGIPARRQSPIPALTGLNVEQLRPSDERRNQNVKPCVHVCVCVCDAVIEPSSVVELSSTRSRRSRRSSNTGGTPSHHLQIIPATRSRNSTSCQSSARASCYH